MDKITDIFEFATLHPDYWAEFLTADAYGKELTDAEVTALNAARKHLEAGIYDLLRRCGEQLEARLKDKGVVSKRFQPDKTAQNRKVRLDAPPTARDRLYGIEFTLEPDDKNERICLYALLVPKAAAFDELKARLQKLNVTFEPSGSRGACGCGGEVCRRAVQVSRVGGEGVPFLHEHPQSDRDRPWRRLDPRGWGREACR